MALVLGGGLEQVIMAAEQAARFAAEALELPAEPEPAPQPAETMPPAEELGSNLGNAPRPSAPQTETPDPTPPTPKFGPEPASDPLGTPKEEPPKVA